MNQKNTSILFYLLVLVVVAAFLIIGGVFYLKNSQSAEKNAGNQLNKADGENTGNQEENSDNLRNDQQLYVQGVKSFENKKYEEVINYLSQAIAANPNVISYYSLKSEAEVLIGKKDDAKSTLESGLKIDPESEILNSKLDVLNKDYFSPADQDNPRQ